MRSSRSCGASRCISASQPTKRQLARNRDADKSASAQSSKVGSQPVDASIRACTASVLWPAARRASHSSSSSAAPKSGLRKARAKAGSWPGEASSSSTAARSSASGLWCSSKGSATTCGTPKSANACAASVSISRLRASSITSSQARPWLNTRAATACAACAASMLRSRKSGSCRGCVGVSGQLSSAPPPAGRAGMSLRSAPRSRSTPPPAAASVVWARNGHQPSCAKASSNTAFTAAITSGALRRVWSQLSSTPSRPSTTSSCAATKSRGSAPRKR